jgi:hypothetical protein
MAFSGKINVKPGQLTLGGQFEAYKRGQLERKIQVAFTVNHQNDKVSRSWKEMVAETVTGKIRNVFKGINLDC